MQLDISRVEAQNTFLSISGDVAQLGEHHVRNVGVVGSNPIISTRTFNAVLMNGVFLFEMERRCGVRASSRTLFVASHALGRVDMEYGTGQVARLMGVHPNTVRLYEKAGLIAPARAACSTGASIPTTWCAHATICAPRSSRRNAMRKNSRADRQGACDLCGKMRAQTLH